MRRVQVRYRASADAGLLRCELVGSWADRNGTHKRAFDASAIDVLAIYCPSPRTFVYLLADELPSTGVYLRLSKARNGQVKRTRDASEYHDPWRMFGPARYCDGRATSVVPVAWTDPVNRLLELP
jgi:PD-(D/E)XK nuclease superfamily protein